MEHIYITNDEQNDSECYEEEMFAIDENDYHNLISKDGNHAIMLKDGQTIVLQKPEDDDEDEQNNVIHLLQENENGNPVIYKLINTNGIELVKSNEDETTKGTILDVDMDDSNIETILTTESFESTDDSTNEIDLKQYAILKNGKLYLQSESNEELHIVTDDGFAIPIEATSSGVLKLKKGESTNNLLVDDNLSLDLDDTQQYYFVKNRIYREKRRRKKLNQKSYKIKNANDKIIKKKLVGKIIDIRKGEGFVVNKDDPKTKSSIYKINLNINKTNENEKTDGAEKDLPNNDSIESLFIDGDGKILKVVTMQKTRDDSYILNKEDMLYVSKTLAGLMLMISLQKKLLSKTLYIKLVEKEHNESTEKPTKILGYIKGFITTDSDGNYNFVELADDVDYGIKTGADKTNNRFEESITIYKMVNSAGLVSTKVMVLKNSTANQRKPKKATEEYEQQIRKINFCETCSLQFNTKQEMEQHQSTHYSFAIVVPNESSADNVEELSTVELDDDTLSELVRFDGDVDDATQYDKQQQIFHCKSCDKSFTNLKDLNAHFATHNTVKTYVCDVCSREFTRYANLIRHLEIHRGEGQKFKCHICGCAYNYSASLTRHIVQGHI